MKKDKTPQPVQLEKISLGEDIVTVAGLHNAASIYVNARPVGRKDADITFKYNRDAVNFISDLSEEVKFVTLIRTRDSIYVTLIF